MIIGSDGKVGFADTKTTESDTFIYSLIKRDQLEFLKSVGDLCPAGYVVCFRNIQRVVFFKWTLLMSVQPGQSLKPDDGVDLGGLHGFSIKKIFLASKPQL